MIWICIWGMPEIPEESLVELTNQIHTTVRAYHEYENERVCVFYPKDMMRWGLGMEVLVEVKGIAYECTTLQDKIFTGIRDLVRKAAGKVCEVCEVLVPTPDEEGEPQVYRYDVDKTPEDCKVMRD